MLALDPARLLVRAEVRLRPPGRPGQRPGARAAAAAGAAPVAVPPHAATHGRRPDPVRPAQARPPLYETHPIANSQLVYYLGHGAITPVPDVARFTRDGVEFTDGRVVEPDLVILATGYLPRFEFLAPDLLNVDAEGRPAAVPARVRAGATRRWPWPACCSPTPGCSR